jgi:hypothetical protein
MSALAACLRLMGAAGEGVAAVMRQAPRVERLRCWCSRAPDARNTDTTTMTIDYRAAFSNVTRQAGPARDVQSKWEPPVGLQRLQGLC